MFNCWKELKKDKINDRYVLVQKCGDLSERGKKHIINY